MTFNAKATLNITGSHQQFSWWPVGGLGEVGMNCMVFRFRNQVIPVDAGILFADPNDFGIETIFPDFRNLIKEHAPKAWIITHGHEDHIGAVAPLFEQYEELGIPLPIIYAPPFAAELIRQRLSDETRLKDGKRFFSQIYVVEPNTFVQLGDVTVHFMETRHSIPDTCSIAMHWKSPQGDLRIVHTSDFKLDSHRFEDGVKTVDLYDVFKGRRPDILLIDSTNAERDGHSVSELEILSGLEKLVSGVTGRVYVTLFSSNVYRLAELMRIAKKNNRMVCLAGRSLQGAYAKAQNLSMFSRIVPNVDGVSVLNASDIAKHPPRAQMIICSGSQGENRSTLLRMAQGQHGDFIVEPGDAVIFSSKTIPGNEKPTSRVINGLLRLGAEVLWGDVARVQGGGPIHASGHARRDEIQAVAEKLQPYYVIPVHGELRQLTSSRELLAKAGQDWGLERGHIHVVENGTKLTFAVDPEIAGDSKKGASHSIWRLASRENPTEFLPRMLRFESFTASSKDPFLKIRKKAAQGGVVSAWIDFTGRVGAEWRGVLPESIPLPEADIERWLASQYKTLKSQRAFDLPDAELEDSVAEDLARHIRRLTGIRPFTVVHIIGEP